MGAGVAQHDDLYGVIGPAIIADKQIGRFETLWDRVVHADDALFALRAARCDTADFDCRRQRLGNNK